VIPLLRGQPASRLPCAAFVRACGAAADALQAPDGGVHSARAFYVLNPMGDLLPTQRRFAHKFEHTFGWAGVTGRPPWAAAAPAAFEAGGGVAAAAAAAAAAAVAGGGGAAELPQPQQVLKRALCDKELFVYCGHGDGRALLPGPELRGLPRCAVSLLMGCSSGALRPHGGLAPSGTPLHYLHARCPALVANLWDVTDGEIDRLCDHLLDRCAGEGGELLTAARAGARRVPPALPHRRRRAVCYGVPVTTLPRGVGEGVEEPRARAKR